MKLTKTKLKQIIKEELGKVLKENYGRHQGGWYGTGPDRPVDTSGIDTSVPELKPTDPREEHRVYEELENGLKNLGMYSEVLENEEHDHKTPLLNMIANGVEHDAIRNNIKKYLNNEELFGWRVGDFVF